MAKAGFSKGKEMYGLVRDIDKLAFLNRPQDYDRLWEAAVSDKNRIKSPGIIT